MGNSHGTWWLDDILEYFFTQWVPIISVSRYVKGGLVHLYSIVIELSSFMCLGMSETSKLSLEVVYSFQKKKGWK